MATVIISYDVPLTTNPVSTELLIKSYLIAIIEISTFTFLGKQAT